MKRDTKQTKNNETNEKVSIFRLFRYFSFVSCLFLSLGMQSFQDTADLIFHNGFIWTVDEAKPQVEAIAIRGDKIIKTGGNQEVLAMKGRNTRLIDLKGAFAVPGFNDSHVHFASAAGFFWNLQLMDVHTDDAFVTRIREYLAAHPGEPIRGGGWGAYEQWEMGASRAGGAATAGERPSWVPDRKLIDAVTGSTPMFISKFDDSLYFANTVALKRAGFDDRAADTDNIAHFRDSSGRVTGAMRIKDARGVEAKLVGDINPD